METPVPRTLATNVPIVEREGRLQKSLRTATVSRSRPCGRSLSWNITLPIRYEWIEGSTTFYETNNSHYEKIDNSYFCIFGARHDAGLVREPARDNRNNDASGYDKHGAYARATVATVTTVHGSDHRRRPISRQRGGSKSVTCTAVIRFTAC
jgi:hypothetical protein